jgi:hypothetical protein
MMQVLMTFNAMEYLQLAEKAAGQVRCSPLFRQKFGLSKVDLTRPPS